MKAKGGYIYFMSNKNRTVLYLGVTANLYSRISQHKEGTGSAFAKKYGCTDLLYHEFCDSMEHAITLEKQLKKWKRIRKDKLIKSFNPELRDLFEDIIGFD